MSESSDHDAIRDLLGAYSLDAVSVEEADLVDAHLDTCAQCRNEFDAFRDVAGQLGGGDEAPSLEVWERISERISTNAPSEVSTLRAARRRSWGRPLMRLGVAALVIVVAGIASLAYLAVHQNNQLDRANRQLAALATSPSVRTAADRAASQPGAQQISLDSKSGATRFEVVITAQGTAYVIPQSTANGLADSQTYQLWGVVDGNAISLGLLGAKPGAVKVRLPKGVQALAVTIEANTGVVTSHNKPIAQGAI